MKTNNKLSREMRTELDGSIAYKSGCGEAGQATWLNISRTGAAVVLGRYLRPGRLVSLEPNGTTQTDTVAIPAEIAWCFPVPGTLHFEAGLKILRSDPEIALHFAALGYSALAENRNNAKTVANVVWSTQELDSTPLPNADVCNLTQAV